MWVYVFSEQDSGLFYNTPSNFKVSLESTNKKIKFGNAFSPLETSSDFYKLGWNMIGFEINLNTNTFVRVFSSPNWGGIQDSL